MTKKYKNTEIGVIPEEWIIKQMRDICWVNQGLQIPIEQRYKKPIKNSKVYITIQYLGNGKEVEYIKEYAQSVCCDKDDILMTRTGNTGIVITDVQGVFHNNFFKINFDKKQVNRTFLLYFLRDTTTQKVILEKAGTSTIPDLNHNDFYSIKIGFPKSIKEQTAIATVLSDTDSLIQALEKKIAKKQLIKKGAMQKLLSPKEGWVVKSLGDFLVYEQPTKYIVESTEYNDNYDIPVLTAGKSFILGHTNEKKGVFFNSPVIIFDDFTTATKFVDFHFKVKSSAMKILKPRNEDVNLRFIFEIMQQIDFPLGDHKRHWIGEFQPLEIKVPKSKEEQTHIAQILTDMDNEIESLKKKLVKYKQVKQGLMQVLLTGKIRLI
ncbi:MAG: restriction endonuclease subunit S [Bacteroidota bacterium]|nr:restriction endonuclease subunit S [Bacteroidota bacterium]